MRASDKLRQCLNFVLNKIVCKHLMNEHTEKKLMHWEQNI